MSGGHSTYTPTSGMGRWFDSRLPLPRLVHDSFVSYPVPRNLNYAYTFGGILSIMLVVQIVTGDEDRRQHAVEHLQPARRDLVGPDLGDHLGQVAEPALRVDHAGLLEPVPAVPAQLHIVIPPSIE